MTQQTFDPFGSLELPDMLDQAKLSLVWLHDWKRIKGTPLENDIPVLMTEFVWKYLKRHKLNPYADEMQATELDELRR